MKIRTDFVTNSSSSSFCVEITLKTISGEKLTTLFDPDDGGGNGRANIGCSGKDILKAPDLISLMNLLADSIEVEDPYEDLDEEDLENDPNLANGRLLFMEENQESIDRFIKKVTDKVSDISEIDSVILKRIWTAWGEGSSCFSWNLDVYAEKLPELAQRVCQSSGEEKEIAKRELENYLKTYDDCIESDWGGKFPSGFMKTKGNASIVWTHIADDIEEFAKEVVSEDLPNDDYAEETVTVNLKNKTITNTAEYILGGN